jgi:23S rRNA (uracil1939-C5)-methyltransferase
MKKLEVQSIGALGDGIAIDGERTLHLPRVLPGEIVEVEGGKVRNIIRISPDRIDPFCKHFDRCGGCKFQHWSHEPYAKWKVERLKAALARNSIEAHVADLIDAHGAGRRRVTLHVRSGGNGWQAGFMEQKSHDLVAIDQCPILEPALAEACAIAAKFGPMMGPCDVSITAAANGLDVAVKAERSAVARRLPGLADIQQHHNLCRLSVNGEVVSSRAKPFVDVGGVSALLPLNGFLQATSKGEEEISRFVLKCIGKARHVADLFCGVGTFSLRLALKAKVFAVDSDKAAVDALAETVQFARGIKPIVTEVRNLFTAPLVPMEFKEFDAVVLDPPRAGAAEQVRNIARSNIRTVVYVSCDPDSFSRDVKTLVQAGFKSGEITPIDQFKWSQHLEMVNVLSR